jgi:hypothetical protein
VAYVTLLWSALACGQEMEPRNYSAVPVAKIENFWRDLTGVSSEKNDQLDESQRKEQVSKAQCSL